MAVLLVELHGIKRGTVLPRRVLIGRRSMNHLVIDDAAVSRMHAWIDGEADRFYINDAGSRTGTIVNGQRVISRHLLGDEDEIRIGPARLTFLAETRLRPGIQPIDLASPPQVATTEKGMLFDCPSCHAPLWASPSFAGVTGQCKYCGGNLVVPGAKTGSKKPPAGPSGPGAVQRSAAVKAPPASPSQPAVARYTEPARTSKKREPEQMCGVCQSPISNFEEQASCPTCGLVFHAECWAENYGCSAYGCPQVNALKPHEAHDHDHQGASPGAEKDSPAALPVPVETPARFPWEFLLLAGSVFSALIGALTFGLPSLALAGGTVTYMARARRNGGIGSVHRGVILLSVALGLIGVIAGIPVSWFLYFGSPHFSGPHS